jgi:hypothetical protein
MFQRAEKAPHKFHIPVLGTGFTIDTCAKVARYGIASVMSIVDDELIERMRSVYSGYMGVEYTPIKRNEHDFRAKRITSYMNMLNDVIQKQFRKLCESAFAPDSEITHYFSLLPEGRLRNLYKEMIDCRDTNEKLKKQEELRSAINPGSIDVNIMTKLDNNLDRNGSPREKYMSDALAALRGFALSDVDGGLVLSAGMNRSLFNYFNQFSDFLPDENNYLKKRVILKVSDYRSAAAQGKYLARKGIWVSEYRVESGLNCGGHAFATKGFLAGPILEEFRINRSGLLEESHKMLQKALGKANQFVPVEPLDLCITYQGGLGTAVEQDMLLKYYELDGTGWGSPFLLVPEAVNIDAEHISKLEKAGVNDIFLSEASPLGIPFWNLRNSGSELDRQRKISEGNPGSSCPKGYLALAQDAIGKPLCQAMRKFQRSSREEIEKETQPTRMTRLLEMLEAKACICHDLSGTVARITGYDTHASPAICPGPNIAYFTSKAALEEMINHIYGRIMLPIRSERPHVFLKECSIYIEKLRTEIADFNIDILPGAAEQFEEYRNNLLEGMEYYRQRSEEIVGAGHELFLEQLTDLRSTLDDVFRTLLPTNG